MEKRNGQEVPDKLPDELQEFFLNSQSIGNRNTETVQNNLETKKIKGSRRVNKITS